MRVSPTTMSARCLGFAIFLAACSARETEVMIYVDEPSPDASPCIGVVGFEITMTGSSESWTSGPRMNALPVLDGSSCRIARPFSASGVPLDALLTVTVLGYDSAHAARISGTAQVESLSGSPVHITLAAIVGAKPAVLVIDRAPLLGGMSLTDVTRMVVATQTRPQTLLDVSVSDVGAYFSAVDPGAFGVDAVPDTLLTVDFTFVQGGSVPRVRLTATQNGAYWQTQAK
jgi:hypothetical protein